MVSIAGHCSVTPPSPPSRRLDDSRVMPLSTVRTCPAALYCAFRFVIIVMPSLRQFNFLQMTEAVISRLV